MANNAMETAVAASPPAEPARPKPKKIRKNPQRRRSEQAKTTIAAETTAPPIPTLPTRPALKTALTSPATVPSATGNTSTPVRPKLQPRASEPPHNHPHNGLPGAERPRAQSYGNNRALAMAPAAMVTGGLLGCGAAAAVLAGVGIWHGYADTDSAILAARTAKLCLDNLADEVITSLKAGTYSTVEAIDILRRTTLAYAGTIPGGTNYVERIFREVELVRRYRGAEVDNVLRNTHLALTTAAKTNATPDELRGTVVKQLSNLSAFANNSLRDIADRNPALRPVKDGAAKALQGSAPPREPTIKVNMTVKQKRNGP